MSSNFYQRVYEIVAKIPKGKVANYGLIAAILGEPRNGRIVGWAVKAAPAELNLPCHRVVKKDGTLPPAYTFGVNGLQRALLEEEGVSFNKEGSVILSKHLWDGQMD